MFLNNLSLGSLGAIVFALYILFTVFRVVSQYERIVIFRLGKLVSKDGGHGPGLVIVLPVIDSAVKVSIRTVAIDIPPQDIITKDNVTLTVNAVLYYRVVDPEKAINEVEDYTYATGQLAQTTLRSVCGQSDLDELLSHRDAINEKLQKMLDAQTDPWGIKVSNVELKSVDLPKDLQRAMGRQAEAERDRRAKVIAAEGELQASEKLGQAAAELSKTQNGIQLRYLQTLTEISDVNSKTVVIPIPIDLLDTFKGMAMEKERDVIKG